MKLHYIIFLFLMIPVFLLADDYSRIHVGLGYGIWKPTTLDDEPSKPFKNVQGADPYISASLGFPTFNHNTVRLDYFEWTQQELEDIGLYSTTLRVLSLDFQYLLVPDTPISPFVTYGVSAIWSSELPFNEPETPTPPDRAGFGFNVGAGILAHLSGKFALTAEYKFMYAIFAQDVGYTNNYSGPNLTLKLLYYL